MSESRIRLGLLQLQMSESREENYARVEALAEQAVRKGAQLLCLPELFTTPYFCRQPGAAPHLAETIPGPTSSFLSALAKKHDVVLVGGSFYEQCGQEFYNTSLIYEKDGSLLGKYRKVHIPQDECFHEKDYFSDGNLGYACVESSLGKIAVLICYDQWFPEAARTLALKGAEIIFYPTAIANVSGIKQSEGDWQSAWENVQRGHAIANGCVIAASNRVGSEGSSQFWGGSFVIDAFGKTLSRLSDDSGVLIQEVDLAHGREVREGWGFLRNRRPDTYGSLPE